MQYLHEIITLKKLWLLYLNRYQVLEISFYFFSSHPCPGAGFLSADSGMLHVGVLCGSALGPALVFQGSQCMSQHKNCVHVLTIPIFITENHIIQSPVLIYFTGLLTFPLYCITNSLKKFKMSDKKLFHFRHLYNLIIFTSRT